MEITTAQIKELREQTGAGVMDCRNALQQAEGDLPKATAILREQGLAKAGKRAGRETGQGKVETYIHGGGRIGAMVELNCETDFVARTDDFGKLAKEIAMQIAAMNPQYVSAEDLPEGSTDDPAQVCLLEQPFIRDGSQTVGNMIREIVAKTGENIRVRRFARFELGA